MEKKLAFIAKDSLKVVIDHRTECMGIAMIMVVLYHLKTTVFYVGFLGMDIFLFLSAYGLCRSFKTNSLPRFYWRRFSRIVPMYTVYGILLNLIYICVYHYDLSLWDMICNITSLNYWKFGGYVFEWYLSFLLVFYLTFPILFTIVDGGGKCLAIVLLFALYFLTTGLDWNYDTAIGRIPIIFLGIMCYKSKDDCFKSFLLGMRLFAIAFVISVILYLFHFVHLYVILYMLSPIVIILVGWFLSCILTSKRSNLFHIIGKYTLEIYIANILVGLYRRNSQSLFANQDIFFSTMLYFGLNILIAVILIKVNKAITMCVNRFEVKNRINSK